MADYRVTWGMDVDAETPRAAAEYALKRIKDPTSWAHVFEVFEEGSDMFTVDLDAPEGEEEDE